MIRTAAIPLLVSAVMLAAPVSRAADPTLADCISASNTSIKLRREHNLREARQQLLVCAAQTCPAEISSECERRLVAVNAAIPTLVFEVKDAPGNDLSSVSVMMDGKPLADRLEGTAISIDPGAHSFHFETAGQAPVDKLFVVQEGQKDRRERIVFGAAASSALPATEQTSPPKGNGASPGAANRGSSSPWGPLKTWGLVVGGAGIIGIGIGSAFGLIATSDKNNADCDASGHCALGPLNDARTHANVSTVGFAAGGVLLATGIALVILGPRGEAGSVRVAPAVVGGSGGVVIGGTF
jgi:hypothetical protein